MSSGQRQRTAAVECGQAGSGPGTWLRARHARRAVCLVVGCSLPQLAAAPVAHAQVSAAAAAAAPVAAESTSVASDPAIDAAAEAYRAGLAAYDAVDYETAVAKFTAAIAALSPNNPAHAGPRARLLFNVAKVYERLFDVTQEASYLRRARALYANRLSDATGEEATELAEAVEAVDAKLAELDAAAKAPGGAEPSGPAAEDEAAYGLPTGEDERRAAHARTLRLAGIGAMAAGVAVAVTGGVIAGIGSTYESEAQRRVDSALVGADPTDARWAQADAYVEDARTLGRTMVISGAVAAAVGAIGAGVGAWLFVRGRREQRAMAHLPVVVPMIAPARAATGASAAVGAVRGVQVSVRFKPVRVVCALLACARGLCPPTLGGAARRC